MALEDCRAQGGVPHRSDRRGQRMPLVQLRCLLNSRSHSLDLLMAIHALPIGAVLADCGLLRHGHCRGFSLKALSGVKCLGRAAMCVR
jgi:hypothetical protein